MKLIKIVALVLAGLSCNGNCSQKYTFRIPLSGNIDKHDIIKNLFQAIDNATEQIPDHDIKSIRINKIPYVNDNEIIKIIDTELNKLANSNIKEQTLAESFYNIIGRSENLELILDNLEKDNLKNIISNIHNILCKISPLDKEYMPYGIPEFKEILPIIQKHFINGTKYKINFEIKKEDAEKDFIKNYTKIVHSEYDKLCKTVMDNSIMNIVLIENPTNKNINIINNNTEYAQTLNMLKSFFKKNSDRILDLVREKIPNDVFNKAWNFQNGAK